MLTSGVKSEQRRNMPDKHPCKEQPEDRPDSPSEPSGAICPLHLQEVSHGVIALQSHSFPPIHNPPLVLRRPPTAPKARRQSPAGSSHHRPANALEEDVRGGKVEDEQDWKGSD